LDLMFPWGLSDALYHALQVIASHIPPLLRSIQGALTSIGLGQVTDGM
jgi:FKBP12-rapamycin complex-associated protein